MNKTLSVIKYEFFSVIKTKGFWISVFAFPIFIGAIMGISILAAGDNVNINNALDFEQDQKTIFIIDKGNHISEGLLVPPLEKISEVEKLTAEDKIKEGSADALIIYPNNLVEDKIRIFSKTSGLMGFSNYETIANAILQQGTILQIKDESIQTKLLINPEFEQINLSSDEAFGFNAGRAVVPVIAFIIFFLTVFNAGQLLLQSVAEEKENRMLENILSIINSSVFIIGKIISILLITLVQITVWILSAVLVSLIYTGVTNKEIPIPDIQTSLTQIVFSILLIILGLLTYSSLLAGIGALGKNYKESASISGIFTFAAVIPIMFINIFITNPESEFVTFLTLFPLTSPTSLLAKTVFIELSTFHILAFIILNFVYAILGIWLAIRFFNLGALTLDKTINIKNAFISVLKGS